MKSQARPEDSAESIGSVRLQARHLIAHMDPLCLLSVSARQRACSWVLGWRFPKVFWSTVLPTRL